MCADILGRPLPEADYRALPRVTFTDPEIGSVGLTEAQAREHGGDVTVLHEPIAASARGWIHRGEGFVKLVARDGVLVGATSMGPTGGEVLGLLALAVHARVPVETHALDDLRLPHVPPRRRLGAVVAAEQRGEDGRAPDAAAVRGGPRPGRR